ncbi:MAG: hypothetical protein NW206_19620 [Hyphomonadaceae bacterium]|nr:hypothetical protein [Hyphomonadaceae bacterium]
MIRDDLRRSIGWWRQKERLVIDASGRIALQPFDWAKTTHITRS